MELRSMLAVCMDLCMTIASYTLWMMQVLVPGIIPAAYCMLQVSKWWLYTKWTICMLQVWVHCDGIMCTIACYGMCTIIFLIVTVNMAYHIIVLISLNFVFQRSIISVWISFLLISVELFAVWVSIHVYRSLEVVSFTICHPFAIAAASFDLVLGLRLESSPGSHISAEVVMFYNCQTPTKKCALSSVIYRFLM